jgi:exoribonuclease-2
VLIIPELAYQTKVRLRDGMVLDQRLRLAVSEIDLPGQSAYFRIVN